MACILCELFNFAFKHIDIDMDIKHELDKIINFDKASFGFYKKKCLKAHNSDVTKGIPYIYYTRNLKVLGKIIPIDKNKYDDNSMIEIKYLELFNKDLMESNIMQSIPILFNYYTCVNNDNTCISKIFYSRFSGVPEVLENVSNVMFCEYCSLGDIDTWSHDNLIDEMTWKNVIAQVVLTFIILQEKYLFIHNDFHPGNVLLEKTKTENNIIFKNFCVKNKGVLVKIWDFEFANIYKKGYEEYSNPIKFDIGFNKSYDIHAFLKGLLQISYLPIGVSNFIENLYPLELLYEYPFCHKIVNTCSDNKFISNGFLTKYSTIRYKNTLPTPEKLLDCVYLRDTILYA